MRTKLISIIVIFDRFRREKLVRLLNSLKPQLPRTSAEVLLVHETAIAEKNIPELPVPVRYITVPEKQGIPFNRNQGIKHAQGKFIVFIDDDCWTHPEWLSSLLKPLQKNESIMAVTGGTRVPKSNFLGDCIAALGFPGGGSLGFDKVWKVSADGFTNHLSVGNCALRRELFNKVGYFDEGLKSGAEDAEFSCRLEKAGISVRYVPEAYAFHEARTTWNSFVQWQLRRGRANYHFKRKIGNVNTFISLRLWSTKNILRNNLFNWRLPAILFLQGGSFALQQAGYLKEKWKHG